MPENQPKLQVPDLRFNRKIGQHAGKFCTTEGAELTAEEYEKYLPAVVPTEADKEFLRSVMKEEGWIMPKKETEFEPSEGARRR